MPHYIVTLIANYIAVHRIRKIPSNPWNQSTSPYSSRKLFFKKKNIENAFKIQLNSLEVSKIIVINDVGLR